MRINTQQVLQELLSRPYVPFTVFMLRDEISKKIQQNPEVTPQEIVVSFLNTTLKNLVDTVNINLLNEIASAIKVKILELPPTTLTLSANPSVEEVANFCNRIHIELQQTQQHKEELLHFVSIFTNAKGYVVSFASAAEIILKETFDSRKEFKYQKDAILNDMEVYKTYLTNLLKELGRILEDVLSPRMNLQLRMESSLRLLEKYRDPTARGFSIQT